MIKIGTVTLFGGTGGLDPESSFSFSRPGLTTQITASGSVISTDTNVKMLRGTCIVRMVPGPTARAFAVWLRDTAKFGAVSFRMECDSVSDLGLGFGVAIPTAYFDGPASSDGVIKPFGRLDIFDISFPYWAVV